MRDSDTNQGRELFERGEVDMKEMLEKTVEEITVNRKAEAEALADKLRTETPPQVRESILQEVDEINKQVKMSFQY